jgi:hypothetical protein
MGRVETAAYVSTRQIGEATVTIISEGSSPWAPGLLAPEDEWRRAMADANAAGEIMLGLNFAHVKLGNSSSVIDLGFNDATPEHDFPPGYVRQPGIIAGLASRGALPTASGARDVAEDYTLQTGR